MHNIGSKDLLMDQSELRMLDGASCAFGVFDGIHMGHRFIIDKTIEIANRKNIPSCIITFNIDPDEYFKKPGLKKLMSNETRLKTLHDSGVDGLIVLDFAKLADIEAADFLDRILSDNAPLELNVGKDVRFGRRAQGDIGTFVEWGARYGMQVNAYDLLYEDGLPITSTRIRTLLANGDIDEATRYLGHPYSIEAVVVKGRGEGADMGFRTANINVDDSLLAIKEGVYAAQANVDGDLFKAAVSVGVSPTFKDASSADVEVHILDYTGNLYGKVISVGFLERTRDMIKFDDVNDLIAQVKADIDHVRKSPLFA